MSEQELLQIAQQPLQSLGIGSYLIKPVYNVGDYGEDFTLPFDQDLLTGQAIVFSTSTIARTDEDIQIAGTSTSLSPVDAHDTNFSDIDDGQILHEGDDTAYSRQFVFTPDMDAVLYKLDFNLCFGLNVSAYTNGNFALTSATILIQQLGNNGGLIQLYSNTFTSGLGNLAATGTQLFIINADVITDIELYAGRPVIITLSTTIATGTGTEQVGIVPWFCYQTTAVPKSFSRSTIGMHLHAAVSHADKVLRRQANDQRLDYDGVRVDMKTNKEYMAQFELGGYE